VIQPNLKPKTTMTYRILITKTLEVPKNVYHAVASAEDEAKRVAQEKLVELDGDVAIISVVEYGTTKVLHTFERVRKAG